MDFCYLFLRVKPAKIGFLKFILEGYDGLVLLSTVNNSSGLIRLAVPSSCYTELVNLLDNLSPDLVSPFNVLP